MNLLTIFLTLKFPILSITFILFFSHESNTSKESQIKDSTSIPVDQNDEVSLHIGSVFDFRNNDNDQLSDVNPKIINNNPKNLIKPKNAKDMSSDEIHVIQRRLKADRMAVVNNATTTTTMTTNEIKEDYWNRIYGF